MADARRATADEEVRALRDVATQVGTALRAGPGRAHEGAVPAARLASELKERITALRRRVLLAAEWASGASPVDLAKHVGLLKDQALLSASVSALKAQLSSGRAAMGGRSGGATIEGLTEVARSLGLQWDAKSTDEGGVHFEAGNEAFLLDCHAPPPPARPRLELHLTMRTPQGPAVLGVTAEALADVERAVLAHDWQTLARVLRYLTRLYAICPTAELRVRLDALPAQLSTLLKGQQMSLVAAPSAEGARVELYHAPLELQGDALRQVLTIQAETDGCGSELGSSLVYVARFTPPLLLPLPALAQLRSLLLPLPPHSSSSLLRRASPLLSSSLSSQSRQHSSVSALLGIDSSAEVNIWGTRLLFQVHEPRMPLLTVLLLPFSAIAHAPFIIRLAQQTALYTRLLRSCFLSHSHTPLSASSPPSASLPSTSSSASVLPPSFSSSALSWRPVELLVQPPETLTIVLRGGSSFISLCVSVALGGQLTLSFHGPALVPLPYLTSVVQASHSIPVLLYYLLKALGE